MEKFILIFQILVSFGLLTLILLQNKGGGLGEFGGRNDFYTSKRGVEKLIFLITVVLVILFLSAAIVNTLISLR